MALVPKAMYRFNVISIKLPMALIHRTNSPPHHSLYRTMKDPEMPKQYRRKKSKQKAKGS